MEQFLYYEKLQYEISNYLNYACVLVNIMQIFMISNLLHNRGRKCQLELGKKTGTDYPNRNQPENWIQNRTRTERFILLGPKFFHPKNRIRTRPKPKFKNTQIFYPKI